MNKNLFFTFVDYLLNFCTQILITKFRVIQISIILFFNFTFILPQSILHVPLEFPTIQDAINAASDHDTVLVAPGVYIENIDFVGKNIAVASHFILNNDISLIDQTIIDGNSSGSIVFIVNSEDPFTGLTGFTLQNGSVGVWCMNSSPNISFCKIRNNTYLGEIDGGVGINAFFASPQISHCLISNNKTHFGTPGRGWGIYFHSSRDTNPIVSNTTITNNQELYGGGFYSANSSPIIINCIIWNNTNESISFFNNEPSVVYSDIQGGWIGEGNINEIPMFADPENNDFSLSENSPCIDAGAAFFVLNGDTILNIPASSYHGQAPDMGFLESSFALGINLIKNFSKSFYLSQNYPNPFNPETKIKFEIPISSEVSLKVYDVLGREIKTLVNEFKNAGNYKVNFDASNFPSGIYFYTLQTKGFVQSKKLVLLK